MFLPPKRYELTVFPFWSVPSKKGALSPTCKCVLCCLNFGPVLTTAFAVNFFAATLATFLGAFLRTFLTTFFAAFFAGFFTAFFAGFLTLALAGFLAGFLAAFFTDFFDAFFDGFFEGFFAITLQFYFNISGNFLF